MNTSTSALSYGSNLHLAAVKVIPFGLKSGTFTNGVQQTSASAVYQEISIARTLDQLTTDGHLTRAPGSNRTHFARLYRLVNDGAMEQTCNDIYLSIYLRLHV
jgi:hypothetical protein